LRLLLQLSKQLGESGVVGLAIEEGAKRFDGFGKVFHLLQEQDQSGSVLSLFGC
jgi:hypothetical protein